MGSFEQVIDTFFGSEEYPVVWKDEDEKKFHWFYDDLHCPNAISPMYFDMFGWWGESCAYMYDRFGDPGSCNWIAKKIGGYVYTAVVPRKDAEKSKLVAPYCGLVFDTYAEKFLKWWNERFLPEMEHNLEYCDNWLVEHNYQNTSMSDLMIHMEDVRDIFLRHFKIHWILNYSEFFADARFNAKCKELAPSVDEDTISKIMVSTGDRNWDSLRALYEIKEYIRKDAALNVMFRKADEELTAEYGKIPEDHPLKKQIRAYQKEFGFRAIYTHELIYKLWVEDDTPIIASLKSYPISDYDVNDALNRCKSEQKAAIEVLLGAVQDSAKRAELKQFMDLAISMKPLTPDHHFYIDQGTHARARLALLEIGKKLAADGVIGDPEDVFMFTFDEMRGISSDYKLFDAKALVAERRGEMDAASKTTPKEWYGTISQWSLHEEGYIGLWGWPQKYERELEDKGKSAEQTLETKDTLKGLPASAGVIEGIARFVQSPAEFNQIQAGDILVCKMTNPAWIVSFSKISGLVTDAGGATSHPAVVSREFGIPCVVGTRLATRKITSGMKIRVNGSTGVVDILG